MMRGSCERINCREQRPKKDKLQRTKTKERKTAEDIDQRRINCRGH